MDLCYGNTDDLELDKSYELGHRHKLLRTVRTIRLNTNFKQEAYCSGSHVTSLGIRSMGRVYC